MNDVCSYAAFEMFTLVFSQKNRQLLIGYFNSIVECIQINFDPLNKIIQKNLIP